jgi:anti-sigma B factor antagonist
MSQYPIDSICRDGDLMITSRMTNGSAVIEVAGRLDLNTSNCLRESLMRIVDSGTASVTVDLSDVEFIDSTGLGVLAVAARHPRLDVADLVLVAGEGSVRRSLRLAGLDRVISVHPTQDHMLLDEVAA